MSNTPVRVAATGSIQITIDNDNDSSARKLRVRKNGTDLWTLDEAGTWQLTGAIQRAGTVELDNTDGSGTEKIIRFDVAGAEVAAIWDDGVGNFPQQGVRLPVLEGNPMDEVSGHRGDVVLWKRYDEILMQVVYFVAVNVTSGSGTSTSWQSVAQDI